MKNIEDYSYNLVKDFISTYEELWENMKESEHGDITRGLFPDYHLGESVWTHTLMVYSHMITQLKDSCSSREKELLISALLHDIGKPATRFYNKEKNRFVFYGHDSHSTFLAPEIIDFLAPEFTPEQKIYTLKLINYHQILFDVTKDMSLKAILKLATKFDNKELFRDLGILRFCDFAGNISKSPQSTSWISTNLIMDSIDDVKQPFEDKPTMTLMVGLPGSGKSTYIREYFRNLPKISRDDCVMFTANEGFGDRYNYSESFKIVSHNAVDKLHEDFFANALKNGKDFVLDRTNLTHKGRMKFINRAKQSGFKNDIIVLLPTYKTIIDRNAYRAFNEDKEIPIEVIHKMMKQFNMPFANEGTVKYIFN